MIDPVLQPACYSDIPGWREDDHLEAFQTFCRSAEAAKRMRWKDGRLGVTFDSLDAIFTEALSVSSPDTLKARLFFENHFQPYHCAGDNEHKGKVTAYYEPTVSASPVRTQRYRFPLYRKPDDLVKVGPDDDTSGLPASFEWARKTSKGLVEYPDREAIETGALDERGLELAWLDDADEVFFIHIQGSACLNMTDGSTMRVSFAAKSGHPFTAIGRYLVDTGKIDPSEISMASIRSWLKANPQRRDSVTWKNRSFIFFHESELGDPQLGPYAAGHAQLTPGRSVALDRKLHCFGTPAYIHAPHMQDFGYPFSRLTIGQDTGSAILGPARADLFAGTGIEAGNRAGAVNADARFWYLLPKSSHSGQPEAGA